jgi:preprotein translocase subunit SecE
VAKTANNSRNKQGKGKPSGKPSQQRGKAVAKRADAKPARGKAQQRPQQKRAARGESRGLMKFLKDVRIELGKVTWPTRKDLAQSTLVVLVAVAIATLYTFGLDTIFSRTVDLVLNLLS